MDKIPSRANPACTSHNNSIFRILGLIFAIFILHTSQLSSQCADIEIVDLRDVPGYPQLDDLTVCGSADTLSLIVFTGDPGVVRGFTLELGLPDGIQYSGWEFAQFDGTSVSNSNPSITCPEFVVSGFEGDSLIVINIGLETLCDVDKNEDLIIEYSYDFTFIDTSSMVHKCSGFDQLDKELNSAVNIPILNMLSPLDPTEVTISSIGGYFCQEVKVSQDGLNSYIDSFHFEVNGLELGAELVLDSITANGVEVTDQVYDAGAMKTSFTLDSRYFPGNALANPSDGQMNTNEIITIELCYNLGQCPSVADLPFNYNAYFGCNDEICQNSSQTTFVRVRPTGSMLPVATAELNTGGIEICGTPGTVSIEMHNPNPDTDQNVYTDVQLGFQTCDKPNLDVLNVTVNGITLPDSTYSWIGDDINIDLSTNTNTMLGLSDYDMDGFYDDLPGGDSITAVVEIGVVCGLEEANDCASIMCDAVQFYVEAKTNCGNTFKDFPAPDDFNLVYGPDTVYNPTEMEFGSTGIFGYDFGTYSNDGAPISTGSSEIEVEFCYDFVKENIQDCPAGAKNRLEVLFSGAPKFILDLEYVDGSAEVSTDGGMTYSPTDSLVTFDTTGLDALLVINDGDVGSQVCYKYSMAMDSCLCSPVGYFTARQQVVSTCSDCSGGCDILQACRVTTFRADPNCDDCDCIVQNRHVRTQRYNLGYVDKDMSSRHTPESLIDSGGSIDLTRFIPGDTLIHEDYFIILDTVALQNLNSWYITWNLKSSLDNASIGNETLDLSLDAANSILDEFSVSQFGGDGTRTDVDLGILANCRTDGVTTLGGVWNRFGQTPYTGGTTLIDNAGFNSSNDWVDNNFVGFYLWNYDKIEECGGANATHGGNDCLDEVVETYHIGVGDTIHFVWRAPLVKNPRREALKKLGLATMPAHNIAQLDPNFQVWEHDEIAGDANYCRTLVGGVCEEFGLIYFDCPGELIAETNMVLDDCGGNVTHEFTIDDFPGPEGDPWFTKEYRPFIELLDIDGLVRAPLAYCAGAEVTLNGQTFAIQVDSVDNMFCSPVPGYSDSVCAVDTGNVGKVIFNLRESGAPALGFGLGNCDTLRLSYDLCMICPGNIEGVLDYELVYDWSYYNVLSVIEGQNDYTCNISTAAQEGNSICDELGLTQSQKYFDELGFADTLYTKYDRTSGVFLLNDMRDPMVPITTENLGGVLLASDRPAISEEVQAIKICNPDTDDTAVGVVASVKLPSMVRFVDAYADEAKTMPLVSTEISDDGVHKIYSVALSKDSLSVGECDTIYVGTTLLFCPEQGSLPPKICVGAVSGCAPAEIKAVLSGSGGCSGSETCYTYIFGEVGLQTEFFDSPSPSTPGLCDTVTFNVLVKNVKQLVLLDLIPEFGLPPGLTPIDGSWQVAYPGGPNNFGTWTDIPNPDSILGNTYVYTDVGDWNTYIDINGLEGVSTNNATVDSNKVSFRFRAITECDEFISGSKLTTVTTAADPCSDGLVSSGMVQSPGINIQGALPIDYAQILLVADPEVINCMGTINTFGITALNTSSKPTSDSVITCITIPMELDYMSGSLFFTSPLGFTPDMVNETVIGSDLELCFNSPSLGPSQYFSINFEAAMDSLAPCGDIAIQTDIKSFVDDVSCSSGANCGVFVQNSLNPSINIELAPPFIAEDLVVFTDCPDNPGEMKLYYEYTVNHNGPDAVDQNYTVNFYRDVDGDESANNLIDELIGTATDSFSVIDGETIILSGSVTVDADDSCPVVFEVVYETGCACNTEDKYFDNIKFKGLRDYDEPLALCTGDCLDIEVCDFISVAADSIPSATGIPYILDIDWEGLNKYTLPHPSGTNLDSITYESMTDNSIGNGFNNILFSEGSYPEGFLVATFPYPVNVTSLFIGGGDIEGWNNIIHVYRNTCYKLEYSHDGLSWTDSEMVFKGPEGAYIEEEVLPYAITAQYWRMSSCGLNTNWATSEFRLEGEPVPYVGSAPVSRVGNTVTICIPADQGIDNPWNVEFTTGTGNCAVTETLEIWNLGDFEVDLGPDLEVCDGDCVDLEAIIPEGAEAGISVVWTPSLYLSDTTSLEVEACVQEDMEYIVEITFPGGCVKRDTINIDWNDVVPVSTLVDDDEVCFNEGFNTIVADPGYDSYEWYQIIGGTPVLLEVTTDNQYTVLDSADYIVKAYTDGVLCPTVSTPIDVSFEHCVDLALIKEFIDPVPGSPAIGEEVTYLISVVNQGGQPIDEVTITDSIPLGLTMPASETDWSPLLSGPGDLITIDISPTGGFLDPGDTITVELTLEVLAGANATNTINYAEISQVISDDLVDVSDEDIDSTPDQDLGNDAGGNPDGNSDNTFEGDGSGNPQDDNGSTDEDDQDPASFPIFDLAMVKSVDPTSIPADNIFDPGDTITYSLTVYNQGTLDADSIVVRDIYPCGFTFVMADNPGWTDSLTFVGTQNYVEYVVDSLAAGESITIPITFYIKTNLDDCVVGDNPYTNFSTIQSANDDMGNPGNDIDSDPGSGTMEEFGTEPNTEDDNDVESTGNGETGSQDDHDPANIDVFDLALTKMLSPNNNPYTLGDTATFEICVINQGNVSTDSVSVIDYIPSGYSYSTSSDAIGWDYDGTNATIVLGPAEFGDATLSFLEQVCVDIDLIVEDPMGDPANYINVSEITGATTIIIDTSGMTTVTHVTSDNDGFFDSNIMNDPGGEVNGATDDTVLGEGGDEDDADPATIEIFDLAIIKTVNSSTVMPIVPGGTVTYDITVYNQGTVDAYEIEVSDYIPNGLTLADDDWFVLADTAQLKVPIDSIVAGDSTIITIDFTVDLDFMETSITNNIEIERAEDSTGGEPQDFDSTPGDQDGSTPDGDDNDIDESNGDDDYDPEMITIMQTFDLALRKTLSSSTILPIEPGGIVIFDLQVFNQGTLNAYNIQLGDYVPENLSLELGNGWSMDMDTAKLDMPIDSILAGDSTIVTISFVVDADFMGTSITNNAEIISQEDINGPRDDDDSVAGDNGGDAPDDNDNDIDEINGEDDYDPEVITITQTFDLALRKTLNSGTVMPIEPGSTVIYDLEVFNQGTLDAYNIQLSDYVPEGLTLVPGNGWAMTGDTANLEMPIDSILAHDSTIVMISFTVDDDFMLTSITNNAEIESQEDINGPRDDDDSVAGDNGGDAPDDNDNDIDETGGEDDYDPEVISIMQTFDLALRKTLNSGTLQPIVPGGTVIFDLEVFNQGTLDAYEIQLSDYVPHGLTLEAGNGWVMVSDTAYLIMEIDSIAAHDSTVVQISFTVDDDFMLTSITNNAEIESQEDINGPRDDDDSDAGDNGGDAPDDNDNDIDETGGEDDYDPETITIMQTFDLALRKTLNNGTTMPIVPGGVVIFDLSVFNQGTLDAYNIQLSDYVPEGLTLEVANGWTMTGDTANLVMPIDSIVAGDSTVVQISFTVDDDFMLTSITNNAEIESQEDINGPRDDDDSDAGDNGGDAPDDNDNDIDEIGGEDDYDPEEITITQTFDLALRKTLNSGTMMPIVPGSVVIFDLSVFNQGTLDAYNIQLSDYVPEGLTLEVANGWTMTGDTANLVMPIDSIGAGDSTLVQISFTVDSDFMLTSITNNSEIESQEDINGPRDDDDSDAGDNGGDAPDDNDNDIDETGGEDDYDPEVITIMQTFDLALRKTLNAGTTTPIVPGGTVIFDLTVFNQGTLNAYEIQLSDYVPEGLTLVPANGWVMVADTAYLLMEIDSIEAHDSTTVQISFVVDEDFMLPTITNNAEIESQEDVNGPRDDDDSTAGDNGGDAPDDNDNDIDETMGEDDYDPEVINILQRFDLAITKRLNSATVMPIVHGGTVIFDLEVFNQGTLDAYNIQLSDYVPDGLSLVPANGWVMNGDTANLVMPIDSILAEDSTIVQITFTVDEGFMSPTITNNVEIESQEDINGPRDDDDSDAGDQDGSIPDDNDNDIDETMGEDDYDPEEINIMQVFDLALRKTLNSSTVMPIVPGGVVIFDLSVFNQGTLDAYNIQLSDYVPEGLTLVPGNGWSMTMDTANLDTPIMQIDAGDSTTVQISFTVDNDFMLTSITNNAEIESQEDINGPRDDDDSDAGDNGGDAPDDNDDDIIETMGEDDYDPEMITITQTFDLALRKTLNSVTAMPIVPGGTVIFDLEVFNQGTLDAYNIQLSDYVPEGLTLVPGNGWTMTMDTANLDTPIMQIDAGDSTTVQISFTVDDDFMLTSITNNAEIESQEDINGPRDDDDSDAGDNGGDAPDDNDDDIEEMMGEDDFDPEMIVITQTFDLALRKTLNSGTMMPIVPGGTVIFDLSVFNQGTLNAYNIQLSDYVPEGLTLIPGNGWTMTMDTANLDTPIIQIDAGDSTTVQISFTVDEDFMLTSITNNAEIESQEDVNGPRDDDDSDAGDNGGDAPDDNDNDIDEMMGEDDFDPEMIVITQTFDLALRKTLNSSTTMPIVPGGTVIFDLSVFNQGTLDAYNIQLSDYVPEGLTLVPGNGWTMNMDTANMDTPIMQIDAGDSTIVQITFTVDEGFMLTSITNNAEIESQEDINGPRDDDDSDAGDNGGDAPDDNDNDIDEMMGEDDYDPEVIEITQTFDLALRKTLNSITTMPIVPGSTVIFDLTVFNQGTLDAYNIQLSDYVPEGLTLVPGNGWTMNMDTANMDTPIMQIDAGDSTTILISFTVDDDFMLTSITNNAEIESQEDINGPRDDDDSDAGDNGGDAPDDNDDDIDETMGEDDYDPEMIDITQTFDLALRKTLNSSTTMPIVPGGTVIFDLSVFNQGTLDAYNVQLSDYVPEGLTLVPGNGWTMNMDTANLDTPIMQIDAGDSTTVQISFTVDDNFMLTSITNNAEIESQEDINGPRDDDDSDAGDNGGDAPDDNDDDIEEMMGEDDFDPEMIVITQTFDLALRKTLNSGTMMPIVPGGTVIFDLSVFNQGTLDAYNIQLSDYVPEGLTLVPGNGWTMTMDTANLDTPIMQLDAGDSTTLQITFTVDDDFMLTSITNNAEIESQEDVNGPRDDDDSDAGDNGGDAPDDNDDDIDETMGEDDYDPEVIDITQTFDLALRKTLNSGTMMPIVPGGVVIFDLSVFNQGTLDAYNIQLSDYVPEGLTLIPGNGWTMTMDTANLITPIMQIDAGDSTTIQISFTVDDDFMLTSITNNAEIESQEDVNGPRDDDDSDAGDNGGDAPDDNDDDIDEMMGEDDYDPEVIDITHRFDLAIRKTLNSLTELPVEPGDTVIFNLDVFNQGTLDAYNIQLSDYVPDGLTLLPNTGWVMNMDTANLITPIMQLDAGDSTTVFISFIINDDFMGTSITNNVEIESQEDINGPRDDDDSDAGDNGGDAPDDNDNDIDETMGEDDYDPEVLDIMHTFDLALIKYLDPTTPMPIIVGGIVRYNLVIFNQGTLDAYDVHVNDYVPPTLILNDDNWVMDGDTAKLIEPIDFIGIGSSDTITITMTIDTSFMGGPIVNNAEIDGASDINGPRDDDDSTPGDQGGTDPDDDDNDILDEDGNDDYDPEVICAVLYECPEDVVEMSCQDQDAINESYNQWLSTFIADGCGHSGIFLNGSGNVPSSCGGSTTVTWQLFDSLTMSVVQECSSTFTIIADVDGPICPTDWDISVLPSDNLCIVDPYEDMLDLINQTGLTIFDNCTSTEDLQLSFTERLLPADCPAGSGFFDMRQVVRDYVFTDACGNMSELCSQVITYEFDGCTSLTDYGVIGINQEQNIEVPSGCDVPLIQVMQEERGVCGYVEYMWLVSTEEDANGNPIIPTNLNIGTVWLLIPGANEPNYDPGIVSQNTYFVRCARNFSCCDFGESNVVSVRINDGVSCPVLNIVTVTEDCDNSIILLNPDDNFLNGEQLRFNTDQTINAENTLMNGASLILDAKQEVNLELGFEVGVGAKLEVYNDGCNDN